MAYTPRVQQGDIEAYVRSELEEIARQFGAVDSVVLRTLYAAPARISEGMVVKADGTAWNPGSGAGVYCRVGGAWAFLG